MFNSGPILGSQAGDTTNQWNSPAEAGKDSGTKNATITLKKHSPEYNIQVDKRYPYQDQIDAFNKWFNSLNPKPTGGTFNMKIVPSGTPGSEHGIQLPGGFRLVPPTEVEVKGEWKFNIPRDLEDIKNIFKK